jgi:phage-related protein
MRDLYWIGSSKKDLLSFPDDVIDGVGHALNLVQQGRLPDNAKALKGFGGGGVQELVEAKDGNAFRAVYTVQLKHGVYVLHCFQKKSVRGIRTPQPDIDVIKARLQRAREIDAEKDREAAN